MPGEKKDVKAKSLKALEKLGHKNLKLDEYESTWLYDFCRSLGLKAPFNTSISNRRSDSVRGHSSRRYRYQFHRYSHAFKTLARPALTNLHPDIGGLDPIINSLRESVIYPLLYPHLFSSSALLGAPKGVLLFGPPGCGKTMLAKALAKESGATFINIAASVLTNKWYGESNKLVAGLFSLARKTQPSIVFIDEIDSFLRERTKGDHEVTGMMKAEFMTFVSITHCLPALWLMLRH